MIRMMWGFGALGTIVENGVARSAPEFERERRRLQDMMNDGRLSTVEVWPEDPMGRVEFLKKESSDERE